MTTHPYGEAERERAAVQASIAPLLSPASIIVVGATRRPGSVGRAVLTNLRKRHFRGPLAVINQQTRDGELIGDVVSYRQPKDVPWRPDLAVIAVPAAAVASALTACGKAGVRGAVVLSSGFAESHNQAGQDEIVAVAKRYGMRLIGPNCLGVLNTDPEVRMDATFAGCSPLAGERGGIGLAAQSGAVGIAMLDLSWQRGANISGFVSLGNKADVSGNDMILYWEDDPRTQMIALYLESIGNPRRFARITSRVARTKPIVVLRSGRSVAGARAGASHTAAAATPDAVASALFRDCGVIGADSTEELMDLAILFAAQPVPAGRRIAIAGNGGGPGGLAADAAQAAGAAVPALSQATVARLRAALPAAAALSNPIDLGALAAPEDYEAALAILTGSGEVDAIVVIQVVTGAGPVGAVIDAVERCGAVRELAAGDAGDAGAPITVAGVLIGAPAPRGSQVPWFGYAESAARAVAKAGWLGSWRARQDDIPDTPEAGPQLPDDIDAAGIRSLLTLAPRSPDGWLAPGAATELLALAGIPVCPSRQVHGVQSAVVASCEFPGPVVIKTAAPGLTHKSDGGGVIVGLNDPADVAAAARRIQQVTGSDAFTVQPVIAGDLELLLGLDVPGTGGVPVLLVAAGGVHEAVLADRALGTLPLRPGAAAELVDQLRCAALLAGHRGSPALHRAAVLRTMERLALLAEIAPQIRELDINPLMVTPDGVAAADVRVRLASSVSDPAAGSPGSPPGSAVPVPASTAGSTRSS